MGKKFRFFDTERKAYYNDEFFIGHDGLVYRHDGDYLHLNKNAIVEQYAGEKDKNGVEIYEGDIIRKHGYNSTEGAWTKRFEVVWDDEGLNFCLKYEGELYAFGSRNDDGNLRKEQVVSNIHEELPAVAR